MMFLTGTSHEEPEELEAAHAKRQDANAVATRRQMLAGGGSVAATGLQMASPANRGAAVSVEPEIDVVLSWLTQKLGVDNELSGK